MPKKITDRIDKFIEDPKLLEKMKVLTYSLIAVGSGISIYGAIQDNPGLVSIGLVDTSIITMAEFARRKTLRISLENKMEEPNVISPLINNKKEEI